MNDLDAIWIGLGCSIGGFLVLGMIIYCFIAIREDDSDNGNVEEGTNRRNYSRKEKKGKKMKSTITKSSLYQSETMKSFNEINPQLVGEIENN